MSEPVHTRTRPAKPQKIIRLKVGDKAQSQPLTTTADSTAKHSQEAMSLLQNILPSTSSPLYSDRFEEEGTIRATPAQVPPVDQPCTSLPSTKVENEQTKETKKASSPAPPVASPMTPVSMGDAKTASDKNSEMTLPITVDVDLTLDEDDEEPAIKREKEDCPRRTSTPPLLVN